MLLGSIVNAAAILAGSAVGLFFRWCVRRFSLRRAESGNSLGERLQKIVMQGLALCTTYIGIRGALKGQNALIAILSIVLGALLGETETSSRTLAHTYKNSSARVKAT